MNACLCCYRPLHADDVDMHQSCAKKLFCVDRQVELPFAEEDLTQLATTVIQNHSVVTGVQPKLSLHVPRATDQAAHQRFTIVGVWGDYIIKPPSERYPELPQIEDVTMHLAQLSAIATVPHCLIRMTSGNLAYITARVDRTHRGKLAMEDMCQLTGRMTEHKYRGSYEQVATAIRRYSATPGLDIVNFYEVILFALLTGNADMHLKNFSLLEKPGVGMTLSPAYDLVNTALVNPADDEQLALALHGKRKNITRRNLETAMTSSQLQQSQITRIFAKMQRSIPAWLDMLDASFLKASTKDAYKHLITTRAANLGM
ncbi:MAG: HipA domain-containing protein [Candidatus Kapabacteria bacterium]|nr:HipA domain-containing protein [Candidatus Kapabacteria bacterium]